MGEIPKKLKKIFEGKKEPTEIKNEELEVKEIRERLVEGVKTGQADEGELSRKYTDFPEVSRKILTEQIRSSMNIPEKVRKDFDLYEKIYEKRAKDLEELLTGYFQEQREKGVTFEELEKQHLEKNKETIGLLKTLLNELKLEEMRAKKGEEGDKEKIKKIRKELIKGGMYGAQVYDIKRTQDKLDETILDYVRNKEIINKLKSKEEKGESR